MPDWVVTGWLGLWSVLTIAGGWGLKAIIQQSVKADFDSKLEVLRADLRAKDAQLDAIRSGALTAMRERHTDLDRRRLTASEKLWADVAGFGQLKFLAKIMRTIAVDRIFAQIAKGGRDADAMVQFAEFLAKTGGVDELSKRPSVQSERPFISPLVWALHTALVSVLMQPVAQITMMRNRLDGKLLSDPKPMIDMVKAALPHQAENLDKFGPGFTLLLIDELEQALFTSLVDSLRGEETDQQGVRQASEILKRAAAVASQHDAPPVIPPALQLDDRARKA